MTRLNIVKPVLSNHIKQDIVLDFQTGGCMHELSAILSFSNKQSPVNSDFRVTLMGGRLKHV